MNAQASPLVLTKYCVPTVRPRSISRRRLVDLFASESGKNFILVSAPVGYGKTTLMVDWAQSLLRNGTAVAWVALDPSDDDPIPFSAYLIAGLAQALGTTSELAHIAQLMRASPEIDLQRVLQSVINAVASSNRACVLFLDDYHLIASPAIHTALAFLLEHLPEKMRVVIGSRSDPALPLARMRARGVLLEIRAAHLRFTADEMHQFLNEVMELQLSPGGVAALEERTEGWIAGLQLAALSLSGRADKESFIASFTGSHRYLVEYLLEEVVNHQPRQVQDFLLSTSILERMCAPLCDALLDANAHSDAILDQLERANLFIVALDDQRKWYRYHHLFRDFLLTRLQKSRSESAAPLHRAASEWLAANQFLREAAQHAFQTRDWESAAAFVEQHCFTMIIHSEISTLYEWCSAFPEEVMQMHPMLCILQCWAWVFRFHNQNRPRIEARLHQAEQVIATMPDRQHARDLEEHAAVVRTFLAMAPDPAADPREQLLLAKTMLGAYADGDPGQFSALLTQGYAYMALHNAQAAAQVLETARQTALHGGMYFGVVESTFHLARLAHSQGGLRLSAEYCRQGQADIAVMLPHPEQELRALGCLDIALGCILVEQDGLAEAETHLLHGLDLVGMGMNPYYLLTAFTTLARLYEFRGRPEEASACLKRLEETWPDIAFCTHALQVMLDLRTRPDHPATLQEAAAWCQGYSTSLGGGQSPPGMGPFGAAESFYLAQLAWIGAQIALGNLAAARPILEQQLNLAAANGLTNRVIELSLLQAQAAQAEGDRKSAYQWLEHSLQAGQTEGYLRIFDQGPDLTRLLVDAAGEGICRGYIQRILAVIELPTPTDSKNAVHPSPPSAPAMIESLSERELEVLRLMALGATNQAIAGRLVITVGTVKSHINHILGKLDAHNRTEAVARARSSGLITI